MTHTDLTRLIHDTIRNITGREFTGRILINDLEPQGYAVGIEIHQYYPTWYSAELPDDQFVKFLCNELKHAGFNKSASYHKAVRNTTLTHPLNAFRSPYDTGRINAED